MLYKIRLTETGTLDIFVESDSESEAIRFAKELREEGRIDIWDGWIDTKAESLGWVTKEQTEGHYIFTEKTTYVVEISEYSKKHCLVKATSADDAEEIVKEGLTDGNIDVWANPDYVETNVHATREALDSDLNAYSKIN